jgi:hypothetical protein
MMIVMFVDEKARPNKAPRVFDGGNTAANALGWPGLKTPNLPQAAARIPGGYVFAFNFPGVNAQVDADGKTGIACQRAPAPNRSSIVAVKPAAPSIRAQNSAPWFYYTVPYEKFKLR